MTTYTEKIIQDFADSVGQLMLLWQRVRRDILIEEKLTPADKRILYGLFRGKEMCKADLAKAIVLENSSLTRSIKRLEKKGFIVRSEGDMDRRMIRLSLTELGIAKTKQVRHKFLTAIQPNFPGADEVDLEKIIHFIQQISINTIHST